MMSQHGPAILHGSDRVPAEAVSQYWSASRNRLELWHQTMARYRAAEDSGNVMQLKTWWQQHAGVMEEVLVTEMLTRVVAAIAAGLDAVQRVDEISPVTHAVYLSHLEARNRVQQIMLFGRGNSVSDAVRLNRLRRVVERWTDTMIGRLSIDMPDLTRYGINVELAKQHAKESRDFSVGVAGRTTTWLMNAAMRDALQRRTSQQTSLPGANHAVASSVAMMLRPDLFDSVGTLKSLWMHRLSSTTGQADRVLKELQHKDIDQAVTADGLEMTSGDFFSRWYF
ncbi:hypothetical protein [Rubripirellula obstinata]|nr:hypothetical protein [Rubripirellula obstinata]